MRRFFAISIFCSVLIFVNLVPAQKTNPPVSPENVPASQKLITLRILMRDGTQFIASQREHGVITLERKKWRLSISPHFDKGQNVVANLTGSVDGHLFIERLEINRQGPINGPLLNSLHGRVETIEVMDTNLANNLKLALHSGPEHCCISCDGTQVCACSVYASCGSCCSNPVCCPGLQ